MVITCLHGFLGNPRDWDFLRDAGFEIETPPLDAIPAHGDILLGYSLGGRLALQALLAGANYKRAILVSTGLGIEDESARAARRASDEAWAQRFESEDFETVIADWNAQPVLAGPALASHARRLRSARAARMVIRRIAAGRLAPARADDPHALDRRRAGYQVRGRGASRRVARARTGRDRR